MDTLYKEMQWAKENAEAEAAKEGQERYDPNVEKKYLDELCRKSQARVAKIWKPAKEERLEQDLDKGRGRGLSASEGEDSEGEDQE